VDLRLDTLPSVTFGCRPYRPLFRNGDAQTVIARYWPVRPDGDYFPARERIFQTEPDVRVLAHENRTGNGNETPILLILHGLAASSTAPYVRRLTQAALTAGYDVVRPNVRNCGDTEHLSPTLYHSGLTADLRAIVDELAPAPLFIVGFSMGGNIALKLAGEWGRDPPTHVRGICGISVPIRLGECSRRIGQPRNRIYERRFLRMLRRTFRKKQQLMPEYYSSFSVDRIRSIYEFDEHITSPAFGFSGADDYYEKCSAAAFLPRVRVPSLLIHAADDPFIPVETYDDPVFEQNPYVRLLATKYGGHVAFLSRSQPRFWAEEQALVFFAELKPNRPPPPTL
jgi:hypothetical protein